MFIAYVHIFKKSIFLKIKGPLILPTNLAKKFIELILEYLLKKSSINKNDFNKNTNIINSWDWVDKNPNTLYAKLIFQLKMKQ